MTFVDGEGTEHEEIWNDGILGNKYNPPKYDILENHIRAVWGWFFPDIHPDESACYIDIYFDKEGKPTVLLDYYPKAIELI